MEDIIKSVTNNGICRVCLSSDRTLAPIGKYLELFKKICPKLKSTYKTTNLPICWECQALLQKVEKFQQKVHNAQDFFKNTHTYSSLDKCQQSADQNNTNLSSLQIVLNTEINYHFDFNTEIETHNNIIESIKEEVDEKDSIDYFENELIFNEVDKVEDIKNEKIDLNRELLKNIGHYITHSSASDGNFDDITEFKDELDNVDYQCMAGTKKKKKKEKGFKKENKVPKAGRPYKIVYGSNGCFETDLIKKVTTDEVELLALMEKERSMDHYTKCDFKCEKCVMGFPQKSTYLQHMKSHGKCKGPLECHICGQRFSAKQYLDSHMEAHIYRYSCSACGISFLRRYTARRHAKLEHARAHECVHCGARYKKKADVMEHSKSHRVFQCDHCGKKCSKKEVLERHMIVEHLPHVCKICNITFRKQRILHGHNMLKHFKTRAEEAFCVECNMQFDNVTSFKRHINTSVKHRPKSDVKYPCPECNKLFNKKMNMKYHFAYFHTDRTKYYCEECAKYFLNNYQLRRHRSVFHLKIKPPKNKFCLHCGKGFSERRILENHIRTHTGERPFVCTICSAAFTQSYPLTTHMRSVHKIGGKYTVSNFSGAPPSTDV